MTDIFLSTLYKGEYCAECINDRVWVAQVGQCQECNDSLQNIRKETNWDTRAGYCQAQPWTQHY